MSHSQAKARGGKTLAKKAAVAGAAVGAAVAGTAALTTQEASAATLNANLDVPITSTSALTVEQRAALVRLQLGGSLDQLRLGGLTLNGPTPC